MRRATQGKVDRPFAQSLGEKAWRDRLHGREEKAMKGITLMMAAAVLAMTGTTQQAVPMEQESHHHLLFKNQYVEVVRAGLAPGESTGFHIHNHDGAGVSLSDYTSTEQMQGQAEGVREPSQAGSVWTKERNPKPYVHRVHNVGPGAMDVIDVELLRQPMGKPVAAAAKVEAETPQARVYKWMLAPRQVSAMHTQEHPYLIIAAKAMQLKMTAPDGTVLQETVKAGDFHWIDAKVTHNLANEGTTDGELVEIEMK
jgi:quercetin dioxygenase-like cupin family protein